MNTMYNATVNSPETTIKYSIDNTQTTITLNNVSNLLPPPNLLTIGIDTVVAETILYTAINGNEITVQRGFEGNAKAWNANTIICRTYTAYDHNTFIANINENASSSGSMTNAVRYFDASYNYFVGDTTSGWVCYRWDTNNQKTSSSGTVNKPSNLGECQALIFT